MSSIHKFAVWIFYHCTQQNLFMLLQITLWHYFCTRWRVRLAAGISSFTVPEREVTSSYVNLLHNYHVLCITVKLLVTKFVFTLLVCKPSIKKCIEATQKQGHCMVKTLFARLKCFLLPILPMILDTSLIRLHSNRNKIVIAEVTLLCNFGCVLLIQTNDTR